MRLEGTGERKVATSPAWAEFRCRRADEMTRSGNMKVGSELYNTRDFARGDPPNLALL